MKTMKIVNIIIFCVWALLLSILLYKNYTGAALDRNHILKEVFHEKTHWYDIYRDTKKIGFARTSYEKAGDEIIIQHERTITVQEDGRERVLKNKLMCLSDLFYSIKSFKYTSHLEGEKGITVRGEVKGDAIIFFQETPETRRTETIKTVLPSCNSHSGYSSKYSTSSKSAFYPHVESYQPVCKRCRLCP
jgi:hypothetical protein